MTAEQYVKQVGKNLQCKKSTKEDVIRQMQSDIRMAQADGKELSDILKEMGSPKETAAEFNENFSVEEKKAVKRIKRTRIISIAAVVAIILIGLIYWWFPKTKDLSESTMFSKEEVQKQSEKIIAAIDGGSYEELQSYMSDALKNGLTEESITSAKKNISDDFGELQSYGSFYGAQITQMGKKYAVVQENAAYQNVSVTYTLTFDDNMELIGLYLK